MACDFPEHHGARGGVDWWLVFLAAVVAAGLAGLYVLWTALGSPFAVTSVVGGLVWLTVGTCLVRAVVGSVRGTPRRRGGELPAQPGHQGPLPSTGVPSAPAPTVPDELAARRARRVA